MTFGLTRAVESTTTTGTGTVTFTGAVTKYRTWLAAGGVDGNTYPYLIEDGNDWETGIGVLGGTGTTLTRCSSSSAHFASSTGASLNLTGSATVSCVPSAPDGLGITIYGHGMPGVGSDNLATNYAVNIPVLLPAGAKIAKVGFHAAAASATTKWRVGLYSNNAGVVNAKLAEQTNLITGVALGPNVGDLATPYINETSSAIIVWLCVVSDTANFTICKNSNDTVRYYNNGGSTLPSTAAAQTAGTNGWDLFGISA